MVSFLVMAALSAAPESTAFHRRHRHGCNSCGTPVTCCVPVATCDPCGGAPASVAPTMAPTVAPAPMPGQRAPAPAPKKMPMSTGIGTESGVQSTGATIDVPQDLRSAIDASERKDEINRYISNNEIPIQTRQQFLNTVRQQLIPNNGASNTNVNSTPRSNER